jgi:hypothetical protein
MNKLTILTIVIMFSIFSSCKNKKEKTLYLAGWETNFNGDEQCINFFKTQVVDKATAFTVYSGIELVFKNDILVQAYDIEEGAKTVRELKPEELNFKYPEVKTNQIYRLVKTSNSNSYLGGKPTEDLTIPKFEFNAPFQYIGKFSKDDEAFNWLPFDLHVVAPIYLNIEPLFIDYSDPNNPKVLDEEGLASTDNSYDDLKPDSEIVFKKVSFKATKSSDFDGELGHTSVPNWIQYPEIPTSPKNNKTMRLVCQLQSNVGVMTDYSNVNPEDEWFKQYFEQMNFWGDGDLFVFFEPESKVLCVMIQNT